MSDQKNTPEENFVKVFLIFFTSFFLWVFFASYIGIFQNRELWKTTTESSETLKNTYKNELDFTEFWEVYDIMRKDYYSPEQVQKTDLETGMIQWLVNALWDPNSEFMDPETHKKFNEVLSGDFEWIGAVVEKVPSGVLVDRILKWSPAKKAWILSGDIILKANGESLESLWLYDAVEKIKWDAGTTVDLEIFRAGEPDFLNISVVREKIQIPSVESEILEDNIWYIALNMYGDSTTSEFRVALENLKQKNVDGLIIDVRDNGWGYLQSAVEVLSEFIPDGEVLVQTRYKDSMYNENYYSSNDGNTFDKKIVVLVNGNSASASEITAGALREYNKAILVGEQTYGKWSVQKPYDMDDGSLLKLTIAHWYTPKGKSIEEDGITPDIIVEFTPEDYENKYDRQLEEAKKVLEAFINGSSLQLTVDQYNTQKQQENISQENSQTE